MRAIIEEFGQMMITLIVASAILVVIILGTALPQLKSFTEQSIPSDNFAGSADYLAASYVVLRPSPTLIIPSVVVNVDTPVSFNEYIVGGVLKATNSDGLDLSNKIQITPADANAARFYTESTRVFKSNEPGWYKFNVSVKDATDTAFYGKETRVVLTIVVEEA